MTSKLRNALIAIAMVTAIIVGLAAYFIHGSPAEMALAKGTGTDPVIALPNYESVPTMKLVTPSGWAAGDAPVAASGLAVTRFAEGLDHPRAMLTLDNGDVLVALTNAPASEAKSLTDRVMKYFMGIVGAGVPSPNQIVLLRDADGDGKAETRSILLKDLNSPFGMVAHDGKLYVANTDAVLAFPFVPGQTQIDAAPAKVMDLPQGGNHWSRNLVLSPDGEHIYVAVGSASNIGENGMDLEEGRAAIYEIDTETHANRIFGAGLRNPVGMDFNPDSGELWTVVNERDMMGSDGPPDYLTNVPIGVNYGWPWIYYRFEYDSRVEAPMPQYLQEYVRYPEYALGAHTAPLGLVFAGKVALGGPFASGAFVARHGSWNRKPLSGYDVVFVGFDKLGNPLEKQPIPVLTGFLDGDDSAHGRPTMLTWDRTGALLVSDDTGGVIWRVSGRGARPAPADASAKPAGPTAL